MTTILAEQLHTGDVIEMATAGGEVISVLVSDSVVLTQFGLGRRVDRV
jgi:hypothetical protein